ncbi:MAG TPA: hypothetical protein VGL22_18795 [Terracidiphilus sp.]|jgi:hypothetical protein
MSSGTFQGDYSMTKTHRRRGRTLRFAAVVFATATLFSVAQEPPPGSPDRPLLMPEANRLPDKNAQMEMQQQQQNKKASFAAANIERRRQIASDSAKLLELATDLKKEVDKTDKDTLSINVIRKAEMIEKLAKGVKEKMKLTAAAS